MATVMVAWKDTRVGVLGGSGAGPGRVRDGSGRVRGGSVAGPGRVRVGSGAGPGRVRGGSGWAFFFDLVSQKSINYTFVYCACSKLLY